MNAIALKVERIEKEQISELRFPQSEVLDKKEEIEARIVKIDKALHLGNAAKLKVKITFEDDTNKKLVETTVWAVTDKRVILKRGLAIPIKRIHRLNFL